MKAIILAVSLLVSAGFGGYFLTNNNSPKKASNGLPDMPDLDKRSTESRPSLEFLQEQATLKKYRQKLQEHPENLDFYVRIAEVYLQESRSTANHHRYVPIAEGVIDAALARNPQYFDAMIEKAGIDMTKHEFEKARDMVNAAVKINTANAGAYGVMCDANVELGHYEDARIAVDKMMEVRPDLRSYSRASYLREINGDERGATEAMLMAGNAGQYGMENREWAFYHLGTLYLNEGKLDTANFIFNGILEERPSYGFALSGRAAVKSAKKDYSGAIEDLVKAVQLMPEHAFLEQLSDVYLAMGDTRSAKQFEDKVLAAFRLHEQGGWNVNREYAAYCLNHDINLKESLERATKEYQMRGDNIDVLDTYAWALYKNGRAAEAAPIIERAMRLKTQNPILHFHAGMIYAAANDKQRALGELKWSLQHDPYLNVLSVGPARTKLAELSGPAPKNG